MIFDYESGEFIRILSDNMAIDFDGDLMMKLSDNMAMDFGDIPETIQKTKELETIDYAETAP